MSALKKLLSLVPIVLAEVAHWILYSCYKSGLIDTTRVVTDHLTQYMAVILPIYLVILYGVYYPESFKHRALLYVLMLGVETAVAISHECASVAIGDHAFGGLGTAWTLLMFTSGAIIITAGVGSIALTNYMRAKIEQRKDMQ